MYLFGYNRCMIIITLLNFITPAPPPGQKCLQKWILTWPCCCAVSCRQQSCNRWDRINHCACIRVIACVSSPSFTVILTPPFVSVCPLALQSVTFTCTADLGAILWIQAREATSSTTLAHPLWTTRAHWVHSLYDWSVLTGRPTLLQPLLPTPPSCWASLVDVLHFLVWLRNSVRRVAYVR